MNIIAGWMMPEMNCARKLAVYSFSLCSREASRPPRCCRPNTLTSACPVYISSMCPLSLPVVAHCWTNCGCARLPILVADEHRDRHGDQRDQRQQRRDQNIIDEHADDGQHRGDQLAQRLLQGLGDVVDVVGDPAEHLAARLLVEVAQRQPGQLRLDLLAQPEHRALHDRGGEPALEQREQRRGAGRRPARRPAAPGRRASKSMPWPGVQRASTASMSAWVPLPCGAQPRRRPAPW